MNIRKTFTLRIDEKLLEKLHYASEKNKRSVNNQIEVLIEQFIEQFEKENEKIPLSEEE